PARENPGPGTTFHSNGCYAFPSRRPITVVIGLTDAAAGRLPRLKGDRIAISLRRAERWTPLNGARDELVSDRIVDTGHVDIAQVGERAVHRNDRAGRPARAIRRPDDSARKVIRIVDDDLLVQGLDTVVLIDDPIRHAGFEAADDAAGVDHSEGMGLAGLGLQVGIASGDDRDAGKLAGQRIDDPGLIARLLIEQLIQAGGLECTAPVRA